MINGLFSLMHCYGINTNLFSLVFYFANFQLFFVKISNQWSISIDNMNQTNISFSLPSLLQVQGKLKEHRNSK